MKGDRIELFAAIVILLGTKGEERCYGNSE